MLDLIEEKTILPNELIFSEDQYDPLRLIFLLDGNGKKKKNKKNKKNIKYIFILLLIL
jgi:hypothetical protein